MPCAGAYGLGWRRPMRSSTTLVQCSMQTSRRSSAAGEHPLLLTVDEAAALLRTTRRAMYAMVERHQIPGVIRILAVCSSGRPTC
jgi:Helix-turn-helix domain